MNLAQRRRIEAAVAALVEAEVADSWKGGGPVEDMLPIKEDLDEARAEYRAALDEATS